MFSLYAACTGIVACMHFRLVGSDIDNIIIEIVIQNRSTQAEDFNFWEFCNQGCCIQFSGIVHVVNRKRP